MLVGDWRQRGMQHGQPGRCAECSEFSEHELKVEGKAAAVHTSRAVSVAPSPAPSFAGLRATASDAAWLPDCLAPEAAAEGTGGEGLEVNDAPGSSEPAC